MSKNQLCVARYSCWVEFPVPEGIDLNDKTVVDDYHVRFGELTIEYVDGTTQVVDTFQPAMPDFKSPDDELEITNDDYEQYTHDEPTFKPEKKNLLPLEP